MKPLPEPGDVLQDKQTGTFWLVRYVVGGSFSLASLSLPPVTNSDRKRIIAETYHLDGTCLPLRELRHYRLCENAELTAAVREYHTALYRLMAKATTLREDQRR